MNQTGQYCAYCDAAVYSGIQAEPILPVNWFPNQAFDLENQLLTCPACRSAKGDEPGRDAGSAHDLMKGSRIAWPQLY